MARNVTYKDRIKETTTTTGNGAITLGGTSTGYKAFNSVFVNGDRFYYCIVHQTANEWETGLGQWNTGNTITRVLPYDGTLPGTNQPVVFSAGTKDIFVTPIANDFNTYLLPTDGSLNLGQNSGGLAEKLGLSSNLSYIERAGRVGLNVESTDQYFTMQPSLAQVRAGWWQPLGNATTVPLTTGLVAASTAGTATARNVATTNMLTRSRRLGYTTGTTTGTQAGIYWPSGGNQYTVGSAAGTYPAMDNSGFFMSIKFGMATTISTGRTFIGMSSSTAAPTNVNPSTLTNSFGIAQLSTDATQWYVVYGGATAQTPIAVGTFYGAPTLTNTLWEVGIWCPNNPGGSAFATITLTNLATKDYYSTTIFDFTPGTNLPTSSTFLAPRAWTTNNATTTNCGIDIASVYIEMGQ